MDFNISVVVSRYRLLKLRQIRKRGQCGREHSENVDSVLHWQADRLVQMTERVLGHNPLEILFLALDPISKTSVGLHRQQRENCIDIASLDDVAALRSVNLAEDMVVDMISVSIVCLDCKNGSQLRIFRLLNSFESAGHGFRRRMCSDCCRGQ